MVKFSMCFTWAFKLTKPVIYEFKNADMKLAFLALRIPGGEDYGASTKSR